MERNGNGGKRAVDFLKRTWWLGASAVILAGAGFAVRGYLGELETTAHASEVMNEHGVVHKKVSKDIGTLQKRQRRVRYIQARIETRQVLMDTRLGLLVEMEDDGPSSPRVRREKAARMDRIKRLIRRTEDRLERLERNPEQGLSEDEFE